MLRTSERLTHAVRLREEGRREDAEAICREIVRSAPGNSSAWFLLAVLREEAGDFEAAAPLIEKAAALTPTSAAYQNRLGHIQLQRNLLLQAEEGFRAALRLDPKLGEAHFGLGAVCVKAGDLDEALRCYARALECDPQNAAVHMRIGLILLGRKEESCVRHFEEAVRLQPESSDARVCLLLSHLAMAALYSSREETEKMLEAYSRALRIQPDYAEAHWNLSNDLLRRGLYAQGWEEYEWRWKWSHFSSRKRNFLQPLWRGAPLNGARILLHAEQGLGDAIQFVRYAPLVAARGGRVILEAPRSLQRLFSRIADVEQIVCAGDRLPDFDYHCPLMSLPLAFGTTMETIPAPQAYIQADPEIAAHWSRRIGVGEFKVALAWAGNPGHTRDERRSLSLEQLAFLGKTEGVRFFSLQKGAAAAEARQAPAAMDMTDCSEDINDFADTAGIIAGMDLVLSVDTSVAHLAAAMGKPTWILVPMPSDWRWLLRREDSPWYPAARLFRQTEPGNWTSVLETLEMEFPQTASRGKASDASSKMSTNSYCR